MRSDDLIIKIVNDLRTFGVPQKIAADCAIRAIQESSGSDLLELVQRAIQLSRAEIKGISPKKTSPKKTNKRMPGTLEFEVIKGKLEDLSPHESLVKAGILKGLDDLIS